MVAQSKYAMDAKIHQCRKGMHAREECRNQRVQMFNIMQNNLSFCVSLTKAILSRSVYSVYIQHEELESMFVEDEGSR